MCETIKTMSTSSAIVLFWAWARECEEVRMSECERQGEREKNFCCIRCSVLFGLASFSYIRIFCSPAFLTDANDTHTEMEKRSTHTSRARARAVTLPYKCHSVHTTTLAVWSVSVRMRSIIFHQWHWQRKCHAKEVEPRAHSQTRTNTVLDAFVFDASIQFWLCCYAHFHTKIQEISSLAEKRRHKAHIVMGTAQQHQQQGASADSHSDWLLPKHSNIIQSFGIALLVAFSLVLASVRVYPFFHGVCCVLECVCVFVCERLISWCCWWWWWWKHT